MVRYFCLVMAGGSMAIGCVSAPAPPPPRGPETPDRLVPSESAQEATDREARRSAAIADAARAEATAVHEENRNRESSDRETALRRHRETMETRRNGPSPTGRWNPAKGERPAAAVVPPPARQCRAVVAAETQGRVYTVRQPGGEYAVEVEPVVVGTQRLEICDPAPETNRLQK